MTLYEFYVRCVLASLYSLKSKILFYYSYVLPPPFSRSKRFGIIIKIQIYRAHRPYVLAGRHSLKSGISLSLEICPSSRLL
jgi:hypothetical protein